MTILNLETIIKEYIEEPLEKIKTGGDLRERIENSNKYSAGLQYLDSELIRATVDSVLVDSGQGIPEINEDDDYFLIYVEDINGQPINKNNVIKTGTSASGNLLGNKYIHVTKKTKSIFGEIKSGNILVRLNYNLRYGQAVFHIIHLPLGDNSMVIQPPIVVPTGDLVGRYVYPVMNNDGEVSIQTLITGGK